MNEIGGMEMNEIGGMGMSGMGMRGGNWALTSKGGGIKASITKVTTRFRASIPEVA